jgi:hypothetical protein
MFVSFDFLISKQYFSAHGNKIIVCINEFIFNFLKYKFHLLRGRNETRNLTNQVNLILNDTWGNIFNNVWDLPLCHCRKMSPTLETMIPIQRETNVTVAVIAADNRHK